LMWIQINHEAHHYIFNTGFEMLTASQSPPWGIC